MRFAIIFLGLAPATFAAIFTNNFDSGLPEGAEVRGDATVESSGGFEGSGVLQLTAAKRNQMGAFVLPALDGTNAITSFAAFFKARIWGGTGADGIGFGFAPKLPETAFTEDGPGTGLAVTFDTYQERGALPEVRIIFNGRALTNQIFSGARTDYFADVAIKLAADGALDVTFDGAQIFTNFPVGVKNLSGRFTFSARTGGLSDEHLIDDLHIVTQAAPPAHLASFQPSDDNASPDASIVIAFQEFVKVDTNSVRLFLDEAAVKPSFATNSAGAMVIQYEPPALLEPVSRHTVTLHFAERKSPATTNAFSYNFSVSPHIVLTK